MGKPSKNYDVADRVHSSAIHLLRRLRRVDEETGLSAPKLSALSVLVFGGPCSMGRLAAAEQVRPRDNDPRHSGARNALDSSLESVTLKMRVWCS